MELAVRLTEAAGVSAQIRVALQVLIPTLAATMRAQAPNLTDNDIARFSAFFVEEMDARMPAVTNDLAAEYASRFTEAELQEMIAFYETPVGRHLVRETTAIQVAGAEIGRRYGAEAGLRAAARLRPGALTP